MEKDFATFIICKNNLLKKEQEDGQPVTNSDGSAIVFDASVPQDTIISRSIEPIIVDFLSRCNATTIFCDIDSSQEAQEAPSGGQSSSSPQLSPTLRIEDVWKGAISRVFQMCHQQQLSKSIPFSADLSFFEVVDSKFIIDRLRDHNESDGDGGQQMGSGCGGEFREFVDENGQKFVECQCEFVSSPQHVFEIIDQKGGVSGNANPLIVQLLFHFMLPNEEMYSTYFNMVFLNGNQTFEFLTNSHSNPISRITDFGENSVSSCLFFGAPSSQEKEKLAALVPTKTRPVVQMPRPFEAIKSYLEGHIEETSGVEYSVERLAENHFLLNFRSYLESVHQKLKTTLCSFPQPSVGGGENSPHQSCATTTTIIPSTDLESNLIQQTNSDSQATFAASAPQHSSTLSVITDTHQSMQIELQTPTSTLIQQQQIPSAQLQSNCKKNQQSSPPPPQIILFKSDPQDMKQEETDDDSVTPAVPFSDNLAQKMPVQGGDSSSSNNNGNGGSGDGDGDFEVVETPLTHLEREVQNVLSMLEAEEKLISQSFLTPSDASGPSSQQKTPSQSAKKVLDAIRPCNQTNPTTQQLSAMSQWLAELLHSLASSSPEKLLMLESQLKKTQESLSQKEREVEDLSNKLQKAEDQAKKDTEDLDLKTSICKTLLADLEKERADFKTVETERNELSKQKADLDQQVASLQKGLEDLERRNKEYESKLVSEISAKDASLSVLQQQHDELAQELETTKSVQTTQQLLTDMQNTLKQLSEQFSQRQQTTISPYKRKRSPARGHNASQNRNRSSSTPPDSKHRKVTGPSSSQQPQPNFEREEEIPAFQSNMIPSSPIQELKFGDWISFACANKKKPTRQKVALITIFILNLDKTKFWTPDEIFEEFKNLGLPINLDCQSFIDFAKICTNKSSFAMCFEKPQDGHQSSIKYTGEFPEKPEFPTFDSLYDSCLELHNLVVDFLGSEGGPFTKEEVVDGVLDQIDQQFGKSDGKKRNANSQQIHRILNRFLSDKFLIENDDDNSLLPSASGCLKSANFRRYHLALTMQEIPTSVSDFWCPGKTTVKRSLTKPLDPAIIYLWLKKKLPSVTQAQVNSCLKDNGKYFQNATKNSVAFVLLGVPPDPASEPAEEEEGEEVVEVPSSQREETVSQTRGRQMTSGRGRGGSGSGGSSSKRNRALPPATQSPAGGEEVGEEEEEQEENGDEDYVDQSPERVIEKPVSRERSRATSSTRSSQSHVSKATDQPLQNASFGSSSQQVKQKKLFSLSRNSLADTDYSEPINHRSAVSTRTEEQDEDDGCTGVFGVGRISNEQEEETTVNMELHEERHQDQHNDDEPNEMN